MPFIKVVQEHDAEGELKKAYVKMNEINLECGDATSDGQPHPITPPELSSLNPLSMLYGRQFMMHVM